MQYAQIIPKLKMSLKEELFTYAIPPEFLFDIKIGQLVEIPFHNKKTIGVIADLTKRLSPKIDKAKIKKISKIISSEPIINQDILNLAKWISDGHLTSLSKSLFSIIPIPTKRNMKIKKIKTDQFEPLVFKKRFNEILSEIKYAIGKNQSVLVLCPETNISEAYYQLSKKEINNKKIALYHSDLNQSQKWNTYQRLLNGESLIVFGTQISAFLPFTNLRIAYIEFADFNGFVSDRVPKFDARYILAYRKSLKYFKLVFSSTTLPIKFLPFYKRRFIYWNKLKNSSDPEIFTIADSQTSSELISNSLYLEIKKALFDKKQVLIMLNKKGLAKIGICSDCGKVLTCPNCQKSLSQLIGDKNLFCYQCQKKYKTIHQCKSCNGFNIKYMIPGLDSLEIELKKKFPKISILKITKTNKKPNIQSLKHNQIIIGTQKIFSLIFEKFDITVFLSPETFKYTSNYQDREQYFQIFNRLLFLTNRKLIIQTDSILDEKNDLILKPGDFYLSEINNRKKLNYPPFSKIIKIKNRDLNENRIKKEVNNLNRLLIKKRLDVSDPMPQLPYKNQKGYGWEMMVKAKEIKPKFKEQIPEKWMVEVED